MFYYDIDYIESKTITVGKQYFKQKVGCCYIVEIVVPTVRYILYKQTNELTVIVIHNT